MQGPRAPVAGSRTALDERTGLETVYDRHHRTRGYREPLADGLLGLVLPLTDRVQHGEVPRLETELPDDGRELARRLESQLGQRETQRIMRSVLV